MEREKMNSLQALRALAFLGIFTSHTSIKCFAAAGAWGVSVFFILSGFLMIYSYYGRNRITDVSFKYNFFFSKNKIKGIYPLHILTMLVMIPRLFFGENPYSFFSKIVKVIQNILLIQSWTPDVLAPINGTAWYLSTAVFLYFMFPRILKSMEKEYTVAKAYKSSVIIFFVQCMTAICVHSLLEGKGWITSDIADWFIYFFPPIRMLDFLIGCNAGYLFLHRNNEKRHNVSAYTCLELFAILLAMFANICVLCKDNPVLENAAAVAHVVSALRQAAIYTPSSIMLVWLFAANKGQITKFLTNKVLIYLGNISQYTFLIHTVVLYCLGYVINFIYSNIERGTVEGGSSINYLNLTRLTAGFIITLAATQIWIKIQKVFARKPPLI